MDQAQHLSSAHRILPHAMVAEGPGDMFLAAGTRQRIHGNHVSLAGLLALL